MSEKASFLPLGSAVKIKEEDNDENVYVIISRAFMQTAEGEILAGYQAILYPQGYNQNSKLYIIKENQILELLSTGYSDDKDEQFTQDSLDELEERIKNIAHRSQLVIEKEDESEVEANSINKAEQLLKDPFYKFRK
ncbi:MAG: DUF4176 domain-containing protein [Streptococcaceae bacterium]|jgi:hypothetical protein|nr:DUF4176 domain-containing protein [Streptococcaceae bacterium]